jgi:kynurenine formamidase
MQRLQRLTILAFSVCFIACQHSGPPIPKRIVDLSPRLETDADLRRLGSRTLSLLGVDGRIRTTPVLPQFTDLTFGIDQIEILSHSGAHLDASSRLLRGGESPWQVNLERLIGPVRIADLRWHDRHTPLQISDLELTPIVEGDVVIIFGGYEPPRGDKWPTFAPLSRQASEYLAAKRIRALATDLPTIASYESIDARLRNHQPPEEVWEEYLPLMQAQIPIIAGLVNLDTLIGEPTALFVALPLPLSNATGSPLRASALIF